MPRRHSQDIQRYSTARLLTATATTLLLAACGGGSGDGSGDGSPALSTGSVAVLFTDAPTDDFCQVRATVTGIDLLSDGGAATNLYTGERTVDVLAMRNFSDFFTVDPAVPIGTYSKVRLTLADLALVECDAGGVPEPES
ncbi:MAG TPA: DUF4382 domain-containing protein, partial [Steroidobacteraceae bacterium]|nr:DUF4382 domain-containing protein [Steroidobacteraceae bacterium]